jgi:hypothetical protein
VIHIHNGDITAALARRAGVPGEHLSLRESLIAGPVPPDVDIETRARFLADAYGHNLLRQRNDLIEQNRALDAATAHDEIVLWFEYDLFCLVHLLAMLDRFATHPRLSLVWCRDPLGTRNEAEIPPLFDERTRVGPAMSGLARDAWAAYTSPDPAALNDFLLPSDRANFPFLPEGLTLHASRFPSVRNGLGAIERRALALIADGASNFVPLFARIDEEPPRFGFGDTELLRSLRAIAWCAVPLITITETVADKAPPKLLFALTPAGAEVMNGSVDYAVVNDADYWLGGVRITKEHVWRWDEARRQIIPSRSAGS